MWTIESQQNPVKSNHKTLLHADTCGHICIVQHKQANGDIKVLNNTDKYCLTHFCNGDAFMEVRCGKVTRVTCSRSDEGGQSLPNKPASIADSVDCNEGHIQNIIIDWFGAWWLLVDMQIWYKCATQRNSQSRPRLIDPDRNRYLSFYCSIWRHQEVLLQPIWRKHPTSFTNFGFVLLNCSCMQKGISGDAILIMSWNSL